ncbi:MAG TPA: biopolymer transporter ExbD [Nevskiaceae bacterium]|nr:biopolymer transporter ExbD [Nevskiaceae bacterium]
MKLSIRTLRKVRRVKRQAVVTSINLVSMIDIFTILIIYMLVNTAAVQVIGAEQVNLPKSIAEEQPRENTAVIVTGQEILVDGRKVMNTADAESAPAGQVLDPLKTELERRAPMKPLANDPSQQSRGEVNIMGDKNIPYSLLKKVMATCSNVGFARISLGVIPESRGAK